MRPCPRPRRRRARRGAAGRRLGRRSALGLATLWLSVIVLLPLAAVLARSIDGGLDAFWSAVTSRQAVAALRLTLVLLARRRGRSTRSRARSIAWVLVRDHFRGKGVVNALIDLPFALPTIVAGLTLLALYGPTVPLGINVAYTQVGDHARAAVRHAAVRRALRAAGAASSSTARWRRRPRRSAPAAHDLPPHHPAQPRAGDPLRRGAGVRPRGRRVRLGRPDLGQHPVQDRGRLGLHLRPDRERRPGRRGGGLGRAARALARRPARDRRARRAGGQRHDR